MEFLQLVQFKLPVVEQVKTSYLKEKGKTKTEKSKITCAEFTIQTQILTCGLSNGEIIQFVNPKYCNNKLTEGKQHEVRRYNNLQNIHKGQIKCLLVEYIFNQYFVLTGSADRTIKLWDTEPKTKSIIQTLTGHTGTILCLAYSKKSDTLFSGSSDKSIRIWKQDQSRKFFMYPWYVNYQIISEFVLKKISDNPVYPTAFQLEDGEGINLTLYVGDSVGNLHIIKQYQMQGYENQNQQKGRVAFEIDRTNYKHHRLNINCIKHIPKQHLVVSSGYDQYLYGFQSLSQKLTLKFPNPKKCIFTSIVSIQNIIIIADESGTIYYYEISSDKDIDEVKKFNCKINQIFVKRDQIFVVCEQQIDVFRVIRGIKTIQGDRCHTDSIIALYSLEAYRLTEKKVKDQVKIVSVSLDNTMRVWNPSDLTCLQVMQNPQKAEISSFFYLKRANLFVTGHQNGMVRLWNIELQTSITISQQNSPYFHKSNVCAFTEYIHIRGNEDITQFMFSTGYEGKINVWEIFLKKSSVQSSLISSSICPQLKNCFYPEDEQEGMDRIGFQLFALGILQKKGKSQHEQTIILSAGSKGILYFTRMFTYQTLKKQKIHDDGILCMVNDQNILFTGSCDHTIKLTNLQNIYHVQHLTVLFAHESSILYIGLLEETGHLVSLASDGEVLFWDYTSEKIVKKIKQKKEKIECLCYVDQSKMLYVGTEGAKILTYNLSQLYSEPVSKHLSLQHKDIEEQISSQSLQKMVKKNQQQLAKIMQGL